MAPSCKLVHIYLTIFTGLIIFIELNAISALKINDVRIMTSKSVSSLQILVTHVQRGGHISTGSPCPICRDEYLILHPQVS